MNKTIFFIIVSLMIFASISLAMVRFWTPEDTWLCQNGEWVQHGKPRAPKPTIGCGLSVKPEEISSTVKVFFNNDILDSETNCNQVFAVDRIVPATDDLAWASLEQLLKGPTDQEKQQHYFSSINSDVVINSLTIENGIAKVDFNKRIEEGGGSCWVTSIRTEITQTLMQFPEVKEVVISVEGRVDDALQP